MILEAEVIEVSNDKGPFRQVRLKADEHEFWGTTAEVGGVHQNPMVGSYVIVALADGAMEKAYIIGGGQAPKDRVDGLKEGELHLKNHAKGQTIEMTDDGDVLIKSPSGTVHINP